RLSRSKVSRKAGDASSFWNTATNSAGCADGTSTVLTSTFSFGRKAVGSRSGLASRTTTSASKQAASAPVSMVAVRQRLTRRDSSMTSAPGAPAGGTDALAGPAAAPGNTMDSIGALRAGLRSGGGGWGRTGGGSGRVAGASGRTGGGSDRVAAGASGRAAGGGSGRIARASGRAVAGAAARTPPGGAGGAPTTGAGVVVGGVARGGTPAAGGGGRGGGGRGGGGGGAGGGGRRPRRGGAGGGGGGGGRPRGGREGRWRPGGSRFGGGRSRRGRSRYGCFGLCGRLGCRLERLDGRLHQLGADRNAGLDALPHVGRRLHRIHHGGQFTQPPF